jgi:hypothetical protein
VRGRGPPPFPGAADPACQLHSRQADRRHRADPANWKAAPKLPAVASQAKLPDVAPPDANGPNGEKKGGV